MGGEETIKETRNRVGRLTTNKDVLDILEQTNQDNDRPALDSEPFTQYVNALVVVIWIANEQRPGMWGM